MANNKIYDVFVSYKHRRHANKAKAVAEALKERGLRVWFDVDKLDLKGQRDIDKDRLVAILQNAVKSSCISVVFAAVKEAVALQPWMTREDALATGSCMIDDNNETIIAWNWQKLEIDASDVVVSVYADSCAISTDKMSKRNFYSEDEMLREVEKLVLQYLGHKV